MRRDEEITVGVHAEFIEESMKKIIILFIGLLVSSGAGAIEPKAYEMPRTHVVPIADNTADRQYELYVKLPEGYSENAEATYPVIYTTDAVWHMDLLSGSSEYLMPNAILVGISWQTDLDGEWAHASRFRDYTLVQSDDAERQARYQFGQASNHLAFIRGEVIQFVESHYRADPSKRAYLGYSLGGAFGAYILVAAPDTFHQYILGSPAFSARSLDVIDAMETEPASQRSDRTVNVFVSLGELEASEIQLTTDLVSILERRSDAGVSVTGLEIIKGADHTSAVPETFARGIKWLSQLTAE